MLTVTVAVELSGLNVKLEVVDNTTPAVTELVQKVPPHKNAATKNGTFFIVYAFQRVFDQPNFVR